MRRTSFTVPSGLVAVGGAELVDEGQLVAVLTAIGVEAVGEGTADALLVVGAADAFEALLVFAVTLYVLIRWHNGSILTHCRGVGDSRVAVGGSGGGEGVA